MSRSAVPDAREPFEVFNSIPAILWTADLVSLRFTWVSGGAERILGYPAAQWLEADFWRDHVHPDDRHVLASCRAETAKGRDQELVYRMIAADGRLIWIRNSVRVQRTGLSGLMVDMTKEHAAHEALAQSEENYRRLVSAAPVAIGVHTMGRFVYVNPKFVELFCAQHESDLVGRDVLSLVHPDFRDIVRNRQMEVAVGNNVPMTREKLICVDGTPFDAEVMAIPVVFDGAKAVQVIVRAADGADAAPS